MMRPPWARLPQPAPRSSCRAAAALLRAPGPSRLPRAPPPHHRRPHLQQQQLLLGMLLPWQRRWQARQRRCPMPRWTPAQAPARPRVRWCRAPAPAPRRWPLTLPTLACRQTAPPLPVVLDCHSRWPWRQPQQHLSAPAAAAACWIQASHPRAAQQRQHRGRRRGPRARRGAHLSRKGRAPSHGAHPRTETTLQGPPVHRSAPACASAWPRSLGVVQQWVPGLRRGSGGGGDQ